MWKVCIAWRISPARNFDTFYTICFFCVGVVYSGEHDVCDVTLSVYSQRASLKNMLGHGGNRAYNLWNTSPMLCQLSYTVRSVRVSDISEQYLVITIKFFKSPACNFQTFQSGQCFRTPSENPTLDYTLPIHI